MSAGYCTCLGHSTGAAWVIDYRDPECAIHTDELIDALDVEDES